MTVKNQGRNPTELQSGDKVLPWGWQKAAQLPQDLLNLWLADIINQSTFLFELRFESPT